MDLIRARRYYAVSCRDSFARGCYQLGLLWERGHGGRADPARAKRLFRKACKAGHDHACGKLR